MKKVITAILVLTSLGIFGLRIAKSVQFKQNVTGYLKRAADANTIPLASQELTRAISYLEANNLTSGYTSILWKTPDEDIEFWYQNLKASQKELQELQSESALEKTNVLMKLRETLLDVGEKTRVTVPKGLAVYPNNLGWACLLILGILAGFCGFMIPIMEADKKAKAAYSLSKKAEN